MPEEYSTLLHRLLALPTETTTVEFKRNNSNPEKIGQYISALANSAVIKNPYEDAYLIWGIDNDTHTIVGTHFNPDTTTIGNQNLHLWLRQKLSPNANFTFIPHKEQGVSVVILRIKPAVHTPVTFEGITYIRTGSSLQELKSESETARKLWNLLDETPHEERFTLTHQTESTVLRLLDYTRYFTQTHTPIPNSTEEILGYLEKEKLLHRHDSNQWAITNLGALLFAHSLTDFPSLQHKTLRVIHYYGTRRTAETTRKDVTSGYANFEAITQAVTDEIPTRETIGSALRRTTLAFPPIALRELLANMVIHQDLSIVGGGPLVEVFDDRIEFSNPGTSLIATNRLVNDPPQSRNSLLAGLARRLGICEEAGSGWDKIIDNCEAEHLPPLGITTHDDPPSMRVVMRQHHPFKLLTPQERIDAAYWHACVQYANNEFLTNTSLRQRFGLPSNSTATSQVSRVIRDAIELNILRAYDAEASRKNMRYIPGWA